jgi:hypothetical protein
MELKVKSRKKKLKDRPPRWEIIRMIGIVGSRKRNCVYDYKDVEDAFLKYYREGTWIVSGGCPEGGDHFAELLAKKFGVPILIFHANWQKYGKGAGFVRNTDIAYHSNVLIATPSKSRKGGTEDTIKKFKKFHPTGRLILT